MNDVVHPESIAEADSDLEVEESMPSLENVIPKELLKKMKPKEKKLQEVINGQYAPLFHRPSHVPRHCIFLSTVCMLAAKTKFPQQLEC